MYSCEICDRQFLYKNSVNRHFRREHINKESRRRLKCTECEYACRFYHDLRAHIYMHHEIVCKVERRTFVNFEEFKNWKRKFEETTHYLYVKHSSSKISTSSNERKTYFVCHRTGTFQSGSCGKRKLKRQGSNKINASCPSTMEVVESLNDGTVKLVLWKTHVGHGAEITRTVLSDNDRNWLTARINEGAGYQKIMDEIQKMGDKGERMCFIKSQDIRNMRINLMNSRNKTLLNELREWVKNVQTMDDERRTYSIAYFKDRGVIDSEKVLNPNDIMLVVMSEAQRTMLREYCCDMICLDVTHCQEDFEYHLVTMYAAEGDNWNPVVYCVTNVFDVNSLRLFLTKVKDNIGLICCEVLLSDDSPSFYAAWRTVMIEPIHHFLNLWYLERDWRESVLKIKSTAAIKTMIFSTLRLLLCESDYAVFQKKLDTFLEGLSLDTRLADFRTFFLNKYANRSKLWTNYSWRRSGYRFETQKNLENLRKRLHDEYHRGVTTQRLCNCLTKLISIAHECEPTRQFVDELSRTVSTSRTLDAHKRGVCIKRSEMTQLSENNYQINARMSGIKHEIRWLNRADCDCARNCDVCEICAHEYSCTCAHYILYHDICEHIHACAIMRKHIKVDLASETDAPLDSFVEEVICEEEIVCNISDQAASDEKIVRDISDRTREEDSDCIVISDDDDRDVITVAEEKFDTNTKLDWDATNDNLNSERLDSTFQLNFEDSDRIALPACEPFTTMLISSNEDSRNSYLTELKTIDDNLQIVAAAPKKDTHKYGSAAFIKYEDISSASSSFGDTSSSVGDSASIYEDILPEKGAIIALDFDEEDSSNGYVFRRYDPNTIINHKMDSFLAFGNFDSIDNNEEIQLNGEPDFKYCYDDYGDVGESVDSVLTL